MVGEFSQSGFQSFKKEQDFCLRFKWTGSEEGDCLRELAVKLGDWLMFNLCKHTLWTQVNEKDLNKNR